MGRRKSSQTIDGFQAPAERWQHGSSSTVTRDPASNARVQHVDSAVAALVRNGTLQDRHRDAADRWSSDYEFGVHGGRDPDKRGSGGAGYDALTIARLESCNRYLDAKASVGRAGDEILVAVLFDRLTMAALADRRGENAKKTAGFVCAVMERLVEHYHETDSRKNGRQRHTIAGSKNHQPPGVALAA